MCDRRSFTEGQTKPAEINGRSAAAASQLWLSMAVVRLTCALMADLIAVNWWILSEKQVEIKTSSLERPFQP